MHNSCILYAQCQHGISGDMFLAALCHLGLDVRPLESLLHEAGVHCSIDVWQECRAAGPGFRVDVQWPQAQPLRHPADIAKIWQNMDVSESVRTKAMGVLDALTAAEAHAHNIAPEDVHFHEVGAVDTLVAILGAAWGMEQLGISKLICSPLPWFSGSIECAHGVIPLPAPATAFLLQHKPVFPTEATTELVTPTGAALVHGLCEHFAHGPHGIPHNMGTGYGSRPAPTGLRLLLCNEEHKAADSSMVMEDISQLESHIDHLTGEELGAAIQHLSALPYVKDVLWLSGTGKKNRPAGLLRVVCEPDCAALVRDAIFTHTHTLGIRIQTLSRWIVPRHADSIAINTPVDTCGSVAAKGYVVDGKTWLRPECDALLKVAEKAQCGLPALRMHKKASGSAD